MFEAATMWLFQTEGKSSILYISLHKYYEYYSISYMLIYTLLAVYQVNRAQANVA